MTKGTSQSSTKSEILQGTLEAMRHLHDFGLARRIEQVSQDVLQRLQQQGWIAATKSGLKQPTRKTENWERISGVIGRVLRLEGQKG